MNQKQLNYIFKLAELYGLDGRLSIFEVIRILIAKGYEI